MILVLLTLFSLGVYSQNATYTMYGTIYDFCITGSCHHPDFEAFLCGVTKGIVENSLDNNRKPILANTQNCVTSAATFAQWFNSVPGVNYVFPVQITAQWDQTQNSYLYVNDAYFPIDGQGWGNQLDGHNFGFCLEIHNQFTYEAGQSYYFRGDDDVWVFINNQLVIDLGGVHSYADETVDLDTLGLTVGDTYKFDMFFCERHTTESHLGFSSNIQLFPCGQTDSDGDNIPDLCDNCPKGDPQLAITGTQVNSGLQASFQISLGATVVNALPLTINYGDGSTPQSVSTTSDITVQYQYAQDGEYTVTVTFDGETGSGCAPSTASVNINMVTNRVAPSCRNYVTALLD